MMEQQTAYRLHDALGYRMSRLARVVERHFEALLAEFGITRLMWCVLPTIALERIDQPSAIAAHVGVNRTAMSRVLREMEGRDLVRRERDSGDGRSTRVRLTRKGRSCFERVLPQSIATTAHFRDKLGSAEYDAFMCLMDKLLEGEEGALPGI